MESKLFIELCKLLQIGKTRTIPYCPQSDGMVERCYRKLVSVCYAFVVDSQKDSDEHIPNVMMAHSPCAYETMGVSHNLLMFCCEASPSLDIVYQMLSAITPSNDWVWQLRDRLKESKETKIRKQNN